MSDAYQKLIKTLRTVFEMDKADLDFGIYRILNQKRAEINQFLEKDLLPQVEAAFADYAAGGKSELQAELMRAIDQARQFGAPDPENAPPVVAIKQKLAAAVDMTALENEVYSHLHTFFSRYYDKGDFISQRRYKADTYAIPYEGEEVKLYWANHDQYYVKSSERLRDYAFTVQGHDDKIIRIKLVEADTEKDNVKAKADEERRFVLDAAQPLAVVDGELHIRFFYVPAGKQIQEALNEEAVKTIFHQAAFKDWLAVLRVKTPTEKNPNRTLLEKHLNDYTARNTFDYFIHKDLGGFLRRELDFYIKNEVLYLDDIDDAAFAVTEQHLRKIKVIRAIALKIIRLLAQIEDFQKKLWLKKKFVVETQYCITLDRVPKELYPEIAANLAQHDEWVKLFAIDEIKKDLNNPGYAKPLTVDFLKANDKLVLDTQFFGEDFKKRLLASIDAFDKQCDGLLINSENFQALNLIEETVSQTISNIFIDPPYNTGDDGFLYKDRYSSSSWLSMVEQRIIKGMNLLSDTGIFFISIGDEEQEHLSTLIRQKYGKERFFSTLIWEKKKKGSFLSGSIAKMKDYILCIAKNIDFFPGLIGEIASDSETYPCINPSNPRDIRYIKKGIFSKYREKNHIVKSGSIISAGNMSLLLKSDLVIRNGVLAEDFVIEGNWRYSQKSMNEYAEKNEIYITQDLYLRRIVNEPRYKRMKDLLPRVGSQGEADFRAFDINDLGKFGWGTNEDANDELHQIIGEQYAASYPKPSKLLTLLLVASRHQDGYYIDYFAGSGSTGHAVINLNREDKAKRKYILVEMSSNFETVLKPRITKIIYSNTWKDGKPTARNTGVSHCFKYLRLESYEDALNNLRLKDRTKPQQTLLDDNPALREDYLLGYWLDIETADSPSLLNIDQFEDPFNYQLNIATGSVGAFKPTRVDLVETFNYLIGLRVKHTDTLRGFKVITGTNPKDESVLIIWRNIKEKDNAALEDFLNKQQYNPRDTEFDHLYVNGDHTLDDPHSKVKMIEIEFKRLMFDTQDV